MRDLRRDAITHASTGRRTDLYGLFGMVEAHLPALTFCSSHAKAKTDRSGRSLNLQLLMAEMPDCSGCGGMMRPDVVLFGESVQNLSVVFAEAGNCDIMLTLGTSGAVYPAAMVPEEAHRAGAKIIEINPGPTGFDEVNDYLIRGTSAEVLPLIVQRIRERGLAPNGERTPC